MTGVAAGLLRSETVMVRGFARLLGTQFSVLDLAAYGVGIVSIAAVDRGVVGQNVG